MEALLCLQVFAPCPTPPILTPTPTPTLPSWYYGTYCCFHLCHPELLWHPRRSLRLRVRRDRGPLLQCYPCESKPQSAPPSSMVEPSTHLFSRLRRRVFSLLEQSLRFRWAGPLVLFSTRMRAWTSVFIWNCTKVLISGL